MKQLKSRLRFIFFSALSALLLFFVAYASFFHVRGEKIVIGAKNCTEQHILAEMLATLIERHTDLKVVRKFNLEGTTICFNALKSSTIDTYFEYTGTAIIDILKEAIPSEPLYPYVQKVFEKKYGLIWLDRVGFCNQYVLITRKDLPLKKISDLSEQNNFKIAYEPEFAARGERLILQQNYPGVDYSKLMDQMLLYFSLKNEAIDVISGFSTDGRLMTKYFRILDDDKECLPAYEVAPLISQKCLAKYPEVLSVFAMLKDAISTEEMRQLNYLVEVKGEDVKQIVHDYLEQMN